MGKLTEFIIILNTQRVVFYPGEQISGQVVVNLLEPMDMRGIKLEFEGKGYCHWTETHGTGDDRRTEHYTGNEEFFEYKLWLCGNGSQRFSHAPGRVGYTFSYTLPASLPSSFESNTGYIRYELKAKIDRPWKFDPKTKRPITVNEVIDTNMLQYARGPSDSKNKEVGRLCCKGPLHLDGSIDRAAYCPGEVVFITSNVQNQSTRDMTAMKAKVVQLIEYRASSKTKHVTSVIAKMTGPPIPRGEFANWNNQPFAIPACPPTIDKSRVIHVRYQVQVEVDVPWGFDPTLKFLITMGTVPYQAAYGQQPPPLMNQTVPQVAVQPQMPPPPNLLGYPDMAPPSYAAAVGEKETNIADDNDQHTFGNLKYVPVYTYAQPYQGPALGPPPVSQAPVAPPSAPGQMRPPMPQPQPPMGQTQPYPPLQPPIGNLVNAGPPPNYGIGAPSPPAPYPPN